jgi:hypothetical protein
MFSACLIFAALAALLYQVSTPALNLGGGPNSFDTQMILGFVVPKIINWMKESKAGWLAWIHPENPALAKWASGVSAFLLALGVVVSYEGSFWTAQGATITFTHVSLVTILQVGGAWIFQWIIQHTMYQACWKKSA